MLIRFTNRQYQDLNSTSASRQTALEKELLETQNKLAERTAVASSHELNLQSTEMELSRLRGELRLAEEYFALSVICEYR